MSDDHIVSAGAASAGEPLAAKPRTAPAESGAVSFSSPSPSKDKDSVSFLSALRRRITSVSVRFKIAGTLIIILCLAVASLGAVTLTRQQTILEHEMRSRAEILVQQLAQVGKEGLLTKQELPVFSIVSDIHKRADVVFAMVVDDKGAVFAHNELSRKGTVLSGEPDQLALKTDDLMFQETVVNGEPILDAAFPILLKAQNLKLGVARVGLSEKTLHAAIREQTRTFLWIGSAFVVCGLLISFVLAGLLTKPIASLAETIQAVSGGNLGVLAVIHYQDEIGKLTEVFNQMILSLREKLHMEKYLSQSTVNSIRQHRDLGPLKLGGERKYVTALFSDVRGFTAMSEKLSPEEVVGLLNIYLNLQAKVVHHWGGNVDKFVGDEVMAIFEGRGCELNAVRAAVEIQRYCKALNEARAKSGARQICIGIGLNSGEVVMGNMGSEDHMDYTVIGDVINTAARLCGVAQPCQVLLSKTIVEEIGDQATCRKLAPVAVKGKDQPVDIFEVTDVRGGARRFMRHSTEASCTYCLAGFSDEPNTAVAKNVSPYGCLLEVSTPVGIGSRVNVDLNLHAFGNLKVQASVHHARKQDSACYIGLCFDDIKEEEKDRIIHWIHRVDSKISDTAVS